MNHFFKALLIAVLLTVFCGQSQAGEKYARWAGDGSLIRGHDTTAYFSKGAPVKGDAAHAVTWKGGTWRFASAREAETFRANPTGFAPQFGAYCTGGLSQRHVVDGNPGIWRIHKGRLYLFYAVAGSKRFDKDPEGVIKAARSYARTVGIVEN
jgi:YHS domain-containing protein